MSDGLITRIGKWIDSKFTVKASASFVVELNQITNQRIDNMSLTLSKMDVADLKTRLEKIELYVGITRKVDPTKPAVAKSAFSM